MSTPPPSEPPAGVTLQTMQAHARIDNDGNEKAVLSLYDRLIARVIAPPVAWLALKLGLSADAVTLLSIATAIGAAASLVPGTAAGDISAVALLQMSYLLDCADGDVARARGTASVDGYLRDVMRHQVLSPLVYAGLTLGVYTRHQDTWMVAAGLAGTALSSRIVGDLEDRVTLDALIARFKKNRPAAESVTPPVVLQNGVLNFLRTAFLRDLALMNWLTVAVIVDCAWLRPAGRPWLCIDILLPVLACAQVVLKSGGLVLLWRRGVSARVNGLAAEIEQSRRNLKD